MQELICILCPRGCHLHIDEDNDYKVTGNACPKGEKYGREELLHPVRVVTSTVRTSSDTHPRLSVKTDKAIPKEDIFKAMALLDGIEVQPPIHVGQVIIDNILGTDANFVATRNIEA